MVLPVLIDPLGNGTVLLQLLSKLGLDPERFEGAHFVLLDPERKRKRKKQGRNQQYKNTDL